MSRGDVAAADLWLLLVDPDRMAHSVLGEAARQGNTEMVRLLWEHGLDHTPVYIGRSKHGDPNT